MRITAIQQAIGIPFDQSLPPTRFDLRVYVRSGGPSLYLGKPR